MQVFRLQLLSRSPTSFSPSKVLLSSLEQEFGLKLYFATGHAWKTRAWLVGYPCSCFYLRFSCRKFMWGLSGGYPRCRIIAVKPWCLWITTNTCHLLFAKFVGIFLLALKSDLAFKRMVQTSSIMPVNCKPMTAAAPSIVQGRRDFRILHCIFRSVAISSLAPSPINSRVSTQSVNANFV